MSDLRKLASEYAKFRDRFTAVPVLDGAMCVGKYTKSGSDVLVFVSPAHERIIEVHVAPEDGGPLIFDYVSYFEKDGRRWASHLRGTAGDPAQDEMIDTHLA